MRDIILERLKRKTRIVSDASALSLDFGEVVALIRKKLSKGQA